VLASGNFDLAAAGAFGAPGFHEPYTFSHQLPETLEHSGAMRIVIALWDAGRPNESCGQHHPLSGCATVDWSDSPSRPKVPTDGVFNNSITLPLASGETTFYLSETGSLAEQPDAFAPG
jgi:hypothetical protein